MPEANALNAQDSARPDEAQDQGQDEAALWKEFDEAEGTAPAASDAAADAKPADEPAGDKGDQGDAGAAADTEATKNADSAAKGADDEQSPPADDGIKTTGDDKSSESTADQQSATQDIWAGATPKQRAAFEAAQTEAQLKERRLRGQVSALQRQINDITSPRRAPATAASTEAATKGKTRSEAPGEQADGFLGSEDWKGFATEYPEVAKPLAKLIGEQNAELTRMRKEMSAIGNERRQDALEEQATLLEQQHPDWQTVTGDKGFVTWLDEQPRHIQEAARRNAEEIVDAREAADVVGRFKDHTKLGSGGNAQQQNTRRGADNGGQGTSTTTQPLSGKRQRQLESASATRSRGPGVATGIPADGDPEVLWKQFDEQDRRQARG